MCASFTILPGHRIPLIDIALLFTSNNVNVTIVTTLYNAQLINKAVHDSGHKINLHVLQFPSAEVGMPEGIETFGLATSLDIAGKIFKAFMLLRQSMEQFVRETRPDCIVADMHFFWASHLAHEWGIPRLVFHARSFFALCAAESISLYKPHEMVQSDEDPFVIQGLPGRIWMKRTEIPDWVRLPNGYTEFMKKIADSDQKSYGVIVDSFYELENDYAVHYRNILGRRFWALAPVSISNKSNTRMNAEGHEDPCLSWLDSKKPNDLLDLRWPVIFQLGPAHRIASALDSLTHPFIWAVKKAQNGWLDDFKMMKSKKGLIIKGWAPQVMILNHQSVGLFVTHCGWNSVLESVTAGVPMVTWPISAEQFYNDKLKWTQSIGECRCLVRREKMDEVVREMMDAGGESAKRMRERAAELLEAAKRAVDVGGHSYNELKSLIAELQLLKSCHKQSLV
ncbi:LOW QUALITY PROTEIN: UDP-glucuronosyl/UDP-glucosyltransferase [Dillenia turbinata]|uniref:Glycosyltransferase n=1 Tax=Dillenia turbinata TaxID=194707 RepID=A0AAN8ZJ65_9MAGN